MKPVYFLIGSTNYKVSSKKLKIQVFSVRTQFYSSTGQLHVPAAVSSRRQADPKDIERNKQYSCSIGRQY
jgi:hypothetical protein